MSGIFGPSSRQSSSSFDFSALGDYYRAQSQLRGASSTAARPTQQSRSAAVATAFAPWTVKTGDTTPGAKLRDALTTTSFVDIGDSAFNKTGVEQDHKKLFALYKGLSRMQALAEHAGDDKTSAAELVGLNRRFTAGLAEVKSYVSSAKFEELTLLFGERTSRVESGFKVPRPPTLYSGPSVVSGASTNVIGGLSGSEVFTASVVKGGVTSSVVMDLSEISGDLSLDNVVAYMNTQMQAAGNSTRFTRTIFDGKTATDPKKYGIGVQTTLSERVSLSAASTSPAVYVAGVSGTGATQTGQLLKLTDEGTSVASNFTQKIAPATGVADVKATATDVNGNVFVVGTATGDMGAAIVQGEQDAYLRKYDAAGQLIWSRLLGSSDRATGLALATDANGNVAIAGKVVDRLSSTAIGGGNDSFVTKFDADGREIFTRQIAPVSDDQANALAFGADGALYVAGQTNGAMASGIVQAGGSDAYLMKLTSAGSLDYVRQFGGTGTDTASAVAVDGDGNVILSSVENGVGKVRKFLPGDGTSAAVWEVSLGTLGQGHVAAVAVEAGAVYVGGATTNAALNAGGQALIAGPHGGGSDGFVMKIADNGSTAVASFVSYVGTSGSDAGSGLAVHNGGIYLAGSTSGNLNGGAAPTTTNAFVTKLDGSGARVWTHQYASASDATSARSVTVDASGGSVLDKLGLPRGTIAFDDTRLIATAASVRAGDFFQIKVNGGEARKITIGAGDTMRSLVNRINSALTLKGEAVLTRGGGDGLQIKAKEGSVIELVRGSGGFDALAGLGLQPGRLDNTKDTPLAGAKPKDINVFGLGLKTDAAISDKVKAKALALNLSSTLDAIKSAFGALTAPAPANKNQTNAERLLAAYRGR
ncbi:MAG: hypothetical protein K8S25_05305 [Alphaproteobacteria bacterium]|nr:hypothetical protein [Alphaproteobacteria bacterium]